MTDEELDTILLRSRRSLTSPTGDVAKLVEEVKRLRRECNVLTDEVNDCDMVGPYKPAPYPSAEPGSLRASASTRFVEFPDGSVPQQILYPNGPRVTWDEGIEATDHPETRSVHFSVSQKPSKEPPQETGWYRAKWSDAYGVQRESMVCVRRDADRKTLLGEQFSEFYACISDGQYQNYERELTYFDEWSPRLAPLLWPVQDLRPPEPEGP